MVYTWGKICGDYDHLGDGHRSAMGIPIIFNRINKKVSKKG
jgi:hypothetical protein